MSPQLKPSRYWSSDSSLPSFVFWMGLNSFRFSCFSNRSGPSGAGGVAFTCLRFCTGTNSSVYVTWRPRLLAPAER
jgi:hypothetical protein